MTDIDDYQSIFSARLDKLRDQHRANSGPAQPYPDFSKIEGVEARAAALDAWLEARIARSRGEEPPQVEVHAPERPSRAEPRTTRVEASRRKNVEDWAAGVDAAVLEDFELSRFPIPAGMAQPARPHYQLDEFLRAAARGLQLTQAETRDFLENPPQAARDAHAVYLPGEGCLVNGAVAGVVSNRGKPVDPDVHTLGEITRARWGMGFLLEYTSLGRALVSEGLYPVWVGSELGLALPRWQPQHERMEHLLQGCSLAITGWKEWLWEYLACKTHRPLGEGLVIPRPNLRRMGGILNKVAGLFPLSFVVGELSINIRSVWDLFQYLFLQESPQIPAALNRILLGVERGCQNDNSAGMLARSLLGWYYLSTLEANLSAFCVPYAMLIAFQVDPAITRAAPAEIQRQMESSPLLNPNTRLAMLCGVGGAARYDPHALFLAAREMRLDAPAQYFQARRKG
jgi:hypothetical protein